MGFFTMVYKICVMLVDVLYHKALIPVKTQTFGFFLSACTSENREILLRTHVIVSQLVLPCDNAPILW